jgi:hypothetical protein
VEVGFQVFKYAKDTFGKSSLSAAAVGFLTLFLGVVMVFLIVVFVFLGELEEGFDLVLAEEVAVAHELVTNALDLSLGHLVEFERISGNDVSSDVLLEGADDFKSLDVHLDGSHEELVAVALVVHQGLHLAVDLVNASLVPGEVVLGLLELVLEVLAVLNGVVEELSVQVHDLSELADGGLSNELIGVILQVSGILGVDILLLQVVEQVEHSVDGITCLRAGLQKSQNLILSRCRAGDKCEKHQCYNDLHVRNTLFMIVTLTCTRHL